MKTVSFSQKKLSIRPKAAKLLDKQVSGGMRDLKPCTTILAAVL
jgi:hypothetical protein